MSTGTTPGRMSWLPSRCGVEPECAARFRSRCSAGVAGAVGVVGPAGDSHALAEAMLRLTGEPALRARLGKAGAEDVRAFTYDAWAEGFSRALASLGLARGRW